MPQLISIGDLIDRSWDIFQKNRKAFLTLASFLLIVAVINIISLLLYPDATTTIFHTPIGASGVVGLILYIITKFILSPLIGFWTFLLLILAAKKAIAQEPIVIKRIILESKSLFIKTLAVAIIVGFAIVFIQIITFGPSLLIGLASTLLNLPILLIFANLFFLIGLIVSLIYTIKYSVTLFLAPFAAGLDQKKGRDALKFSNSLIKNRFWIVLSRIVVPKIVFLLFSIFIAGAFAYFFEAIFGEASMNPNVMMKIFEIFETTVPFLLAIIFNPLIFISDTILYQQLKENV